MWEIKTLQVFSLHGFVPKVVITDYYTSDYPIVDECERLNLTYYNLCPSFKKVCRVNKVVMIDPHYNNYCYTKEGQKVFFDIGSFMYGWVDHNDFSMVTLGCYRLLFSMFPESVLYYRELNEFRYDVPKWQYPVDYREYVYYKKKFVRYHKLHSSHSVVKSTKRIFNDLTVKPEDLEILFNIKTFIFEE